MHFAGIMHFAAVLCMIPAVCMIVAEGVGDRGVGDRGGIVGVGGGSVGVRPRRSRRRRRGGPARRRPWPRVAATRPALALRGGQLDLPEQVDHLLAPADEVAGGQVGCPRSTASSELPRAPTGAPPRPARGRAPGRRRAGASRSRSSSPDQIRTVSSRARRAAPGGTRGRGRRPPGGTRRRRARAGGQPGPVQAGPDALAQALGHQQVGLGVDPPQPLALGRDPCRRRGSRAR